MKRSPSSTLLRAHSRGSFSRLVFESETNNGGGHHDRSLSYRFAQLVVVCMRLVTPCSYLYLLSLTVLKESPSVYLGNVLFIALTIWMCIEALFFPYYYYLFNRLNNSKPALEHFAVNKRSRMRLVKNCFQALRIAASEHSPEDYVRKALEGWFLEVPIDLIKRGNMESWCGWAFFGEDISDFSAERRKQNNDIVNYIEKQAKWKFPPGFQPDLPSARLNLDPVFATQRPFLVYATIFGVNTLAHLGLLLLGYRKRIEFSTSSQFIYHRKRVPPADISSSVTTKPAPLVFVHGIGIGFAHYLAFISQMPKEVDVYLIEWPYVAMQMASSAPGIEESVHSLLSLLDQDKHAKVCLVAHSLGCSFVSWVLHHPIACTRVSATVLIDPVVFLLCDPTVATTVVYKEHANTLDFLMHFFVARELFIANALSRHFNWSHNILFVEDLSAVDSKDVNAYSPCVSGKSAITASGDPSFTDSDSGCSDDSVDAPVQQLQNRHTIVLSLSDSIVPVPSVLRYLQAKTKQGHSCFEVLTFQGAHGEIFLYPRWIRILADKCRVQCGMPSAL